jgi:ribonuclease P protein component
VTRAASASQPDRSTVTTLRRSSEFDRVFRSGRRTRSGPITVIVAPGPSDTTRLGLVVGRKVGGAVERNRVKRRLRHAVRAVQPPPGIDVVVVGSADAATVPFDRLVEGLRAALHSGSGQRQEEPSP